MTRPILMTSDEMKFYLEWCKKARRWCVQWSGSPKNPRDVIVRRLTVPDWQCEHTRWGPRIYYVHLEARTPRAALRKVFGRALGDRVWMSMADRVREAMDEQ